VSETPAGPPATGAPAPAGRGTRRSVADMLRTLAVIIGCVVVLVLIVPRPNEVRQPDVDATAAARAARPALSFEPAVPAGLPAGWAARRAEAQEGTDGVPMWSLQYWTGTAYASVRQARGATPAWEARQVTDGREAGTVTVAGREWVVRSRTDRGITSWVLRAGDLTTIVTGTAPAAELETLAGRLPAATLEQPSPGGTPAPTSSG
jgi:hypothetical protein